MWHVLARVLACTSPCVPQFRIAKLGTCQLKLHLRLVFSTPSENLALLGTWLFISLQPFICRTLTGYTSPLGCLRFQVHRLVNALTVFTHCGYGDAPAKDNLFCDASPAGIVETGLFVNMASVAYFGSPDGTVRRVERTSSE